VLAAIEKLRYRLDGVARSLRRSSTGTIGLMISDITNPYFSELVRGVEDAIYGADKGYNLVLCNTDEDPFKERLYLNVMLEKRIDGLIMAPVGGNRGDLASLIDGGFPVVFVDRDLPDLLADAVTIDNRQSAVGLIRHLTGLGHRRIAVMYADLTADSIEGRLNGYREALAEAGLPADPELFFHSGSSIEEARQAGLSFLSVDRNVSAVFCTNNFMTLGFLQAMHERGVECPDDLAVVGFDDFPWASSFRPQLTVVAQPAVEIGREAVQLMLSRFAAEAPREPVRRVLKGELVIRESCGARLDRLALESLLRRGEVRSPPRILADVRSKP
jgi:LacI family transcriptional regulator